MQIKLSMLSYALNPGLELPLGMPGISAALVIGIRNTVEAEGIPAKNAIYLCICECD